MRSSNVNADSPLCSSVRVPLFLEEARVMRGERSGEAPLDGDVESLADEMSEGGVWSVEFLAL